MKVPITVDFILLPKS